MRILLNALLAKKESGGGFQIAYNFILRSFKSCNFHIDWYYLISTDLEDELLECIDNSLRDRFYIFPNQPSVGKEHIVAQRRIKQVEQFVRPDVVYSILAPSYYKFNSAEVMRCCNAWDLIPSTHIAFSTLSTKQKLKFGLKKLVVLKLMRDASFFITQTKEAQDRINKILNVPLNRIGVIPNVIPFSLSKCSIEKQKHSGINIVYVAAPTPHKNLMIIPDVARILRNEYKILNFHFYVTIPFDAKKVLSQFESKAKELGVEDCIINVGRLQQKDLPQLYNCADIGFFPSLLETFSATLLEYLKFGLPIVASDMPFNREVAGSSAVYFNPESADSAARMIFQLISQDSIRNKLISSTNLQLLKYGDFDKYFEDTVAFINNVIN